MESAVMRDELSHGKEVIIQQCEHCSWLNIKV